ncbi:Carnitine O-acetyltransferase-like [Oopsacas minuta]|uniref:Carnitine O-acetyltransferase-like n=1 Tax=Oopsacas minuta TaxID=111878 RepID=A0AAV7KAT0_9METZ|nr:Carnitine O-acetyltransferase-like [Oopsacas minuta]
MTSNTNSLPRLPVPKLHQTINKFLNSVRPLLTLEEYSQTADLAQEFLNKEGIYLQGLLLDRAASTDNWLTEWWLETAYLKFRGPLPIYSTPVCVRSKQQFTNVSHWIDYLSKYLYATGKFFDLVRNNNLPQDIIGDSPLCMSQYNKLAGTYRIPGVEIDSLRYSPDTNHVLVIHRGRYFKLPIYTGEGELKRVLQPYLIKHLLYSIISMPEEEQVPVGVLTSLDRYSWCVARQEMMTSSVNKHSLDVIEESMLAIELDEPGIESYESFFIQTMIGDLSENFRYYNRWHDIRYQKVVTSDGFSSSSMEHTATDGSAAMTQAAHTYSYTTPVSDIPVSLEQLPFLEELKWEISPIVASYITDAKYRLIQLSKKLSVKIFTFSGFGKNLPKSLKLSPDSNIQLAIQLTFFKLHGVSTACYESVTTTKFYEGRTDTIRSTSIESDELVRHLYFNGDVMSDKLLGLLKKFYIAHNKYSIEAWNGQGIDRHLFGLEMLSKQHNMSPKLFSNLGYIRNKHFQLSTSQLPNKYYQYPGYAPLVQDGYGVCYNPQKSDIHFIVSSYNSCPDTVTADRFSEVLIESLFCIKTLLEQFPVPSRL